MLIHDGYEIIQTGDISGAPVFEGRRTGSGVRGSMKNIIFAAIGPKPEIVIDDAVNNDLRIVKNEQNCLVYDRPLAARGLTWRDLTAWWADRENLTGQPERTIWRSLYRRLLRSIEGNGAERRIFTAYGRRYGTLGAEIPALLPQVYLHYDPRQYLCPGPAHSNAAPLTSVVSNAGDLHTLRTRPMADRRPGSACGYCVLIYLRVAPTCRQMAMITDCGVTEFGGAPALTYLAGGPVMTTG